jgi:predicted HTH domain antitoxin
MIFFQKHSIASCILRKSPSTLSNWIKSEKIYPPQEHPLNNGSPRYNILDALRICIIVDGSISMNKMVTLISTRIGEPESFVYELIVDPGNYLGSDFQTAMKTIREEIKSGSYDQVDLSTYIIKNNA